MAEILTARTSTDRNSSPFSCEPHTCDNIRNIDNTNLNKQKFPSIYWRQHISNDITDDDITSFNRHHCNKHKGHMANLVSTASVTAGLEEQSTLPSSTTSTEETSASSQDHHTQSIETTREPQTNTVTHVIASTLSSSPRGHTLTEGTPQETFSSAETTVSSPASVSNTSPTTSETISSPASSDTTRENKRDTSSTVMRNITPVASTVSITTALEEQSTLPSSTTSTEETSASSPDHKTQSMETTREPQGTTITDVTTSTPSSSPRGHTLTEGTPQETSSSGETTTSYPASCEPHTCDNIRNIDNTNLNKQKFPSIYWRQHISNDITDDDITSFNRHHCNKHKGHMANCNGSYHSSGLNSLSDSWIGGTINLTLFHHFY
ncbi:mucin-4-like [Phocoena phocoena]|uniref:mucin-4-like n=1 Tax=Phocoena phocoena TaxID=9742 RepID=UPI0033076808